MQVFSKVQRLMGNRFELSVVDTNAEQAKHNLQLAIAEIERIENMLSTYQANSFTNKINEQAGINPVVVPDEMFGLVARCQKLSMLTQGAFDLSYGGIDKSIWNFDTSMNELPSKERALETVSLINFENILLDPAQQSIFLKNKGMRIGFGGIGKGYAADRAKALLQNLGYKNGVVNASGDLCAWGMAPNGKHWTVGIADPSQKNNALAYMPIENRAIATSGDYEKFVVLGGKRYSHTINPKTGLPIEGIKSVTVLAPTAELADGLTTPLGIMGVEVALHLVNQLKGIACLMVDSDDKIFVSDNLKKQSAALS
jgi:FAD:protein FMN transferase